MFFGSTTHPTSWVAPHSVAQPIVPMRIEPEDGQSNSKTPVFLRDVYLTHSFSILHVQRYLHVLVVSPTHMVNEHNTSSSHPNRDQLESSFSILDFTRNLEGFEIRGLSIRHHVRWRSYHRVTASAWRAIIPSRSPFAPSVKPIHPSRFHSSHPSLLTSLRCHAFSVSPQPKNSEGRYDEEGGSGYDRSRKQDF